MSPGGCGLAGLAGSKDAGAAAVDLRTSDVSFSHETDDDDLVPGLWQRFVFRHQGVRLLFDRLKRMKDYGETLFEELEQPEAPEVPAPPQATAAWPTAGRD